MSAWKEQQVYENKYRKALKAGDNEKAKQYKEWAEQAKREFDYECRKEW